MGLPAAGPGQSAWRTPNGTTSASPRAKTNFTHHRRGTRSRRQRSSSGQQPNKRHPIDRGPVFLASVGLTILYCMGGGAVSQQVKLLNILVLVWDGDQSRGQTDQYTSCSVGGRSVKRSNRGLLRYIPGTNLYGNIKSPLYVHIRVETRAVFPARAVAFWLQPTYPIHSIASWSCLLACD